MNYRLRPIREANAKEFISQRFFSFRTFVGDDLVTLRGYNYFKPLHLASKYNITFCNYEKVDALEKINQSSAGVVIADRRLESDLIHRGGRLYLLVDDVRLAVARLLFILAESYMPGRRTCGFPSSSVISPMATIEEETVIGDRVEIMAGAFIGAGTIIGDDVIIGPNAVIGSQGFGYAKDGDQQIAIPHIGRVEIQDNVHIGACTCIDRAVLDWTTIQHGSRIDNLVHIAHNVDIGENSMVIANAMIAGSVKIGLNCWIAPSASVRDGISIGENSVIGMGSVVVNDVESGSVVFGVPAKERNG